MSKEIKFTDCEIQAKIKEITHILNSYGISLDRWGTGEAKNIDHLAREILEGESSLVQIEGELVRKVRVTEVEIGYKDGDTDLRLVEDRQEFEDGRVRRRENAGISEKMKPGENPVDTARRAMLEELGIVGDVFDDSGVKTKRIMSPSYPGLNTEYQLHGMRTVIPQSVFNPEGYVEIQEGLSTYFVWKPAVDLNKPNGVT